jgi:hypothetical protein
MKLSAKCKRLLEWLGRRFITHNEGFDFAMALPDVRSIEIELMALVRWQIICAERMSSLTRFHQIKLRRYEEIDQ